MKQKTVEKEKVGQTDYCCPCCDSPLMKMFGGQMYPGDRNHGVTLYCEHGDPDAKKHPQEVSGHGKSDKDAYAVILAKFAGGKYNVDEIETE